MNILSRTINLFLTGTILLSSGLLMSQEIDDSFADGDFTASPAWSGDTGNWEVVASTASTGAPGSNTLHLNVPTGSGTQYLSTPCSNWLDAQTWSFFLGRRNRTYTNTNSVEVWLYANESNLESGTVDGYRLHIGQSGPTDPIILEKVTNNTPTTILSVAPITSGLTDIGLDIKVERNAAGLWTIYTSAVPTTSGTGATADLDPMSTATIVQGSITDLTYTPAGTGYCGVVANHTSASSARVAVEFDQFVLSTATSNTVVEFASPNYAVYNENVGVVTIPVTIDNPNGAVATTVDVLLASGSASRIDSYTTQTLTFPAGSSANQTAVITVSNNVLCDGIEYLEFELDNASGGTSADIGDTDVYEMEIQDDEKGFIDLLDENVESGSISDWTQIGSGDWTADNGDPINGSYSLRHVNSGVAGTSSASLKVPNASLRGLQTTWRFNFNHFSNEPSPTNNFMFYLSANESDLTSGTVDGYAVGVRPATLGDPDNITLWKIVDGAISTALVTSAIDYGAAYDIIGIEVTRDEDGLWELLIDDDGDFDNLVSIGTSTNTDYIDFGNMGAYYTYSASLSGELSMDDISVFQEGCREIYYSQGSGNIDAAIWDITPVGTGSAINTTRFTTLVCQNGHTIDINIDSEAEVVKIQPTSTVNANACHFNVFGNFENNGTFNEGTSSFCLCSDAYQELGGSATSRFYDLTIDNSSGDVLQVGDVEIVNVFTPRKGDFDTDGYNFTLISDATRTASIGMMTYDADFFGEITYQRYVPAGPSQGWVMLGNCLSGATIAHWDAGLITTGFTGADYTYAEYPFISVLHYDETVAGTSDMGWTAVTNTTNTLSHTNAYAVYMLSPEQNVEVTGEFFKWDFSQPLDYTNNAAASEVGWNFVVNRYPSEIDWDALYDLSGGTSTYYVYDAETDSYLSYNAVTGIGAASRYIAPNQAFFIQASGPGETLEYEEEIKSSNNTSYQRDYSQVGQIAISLNKNLHSDNTIIGFNENATLEYDQTFDARKLSTTPEGMQLPLTISTSAEEDEMMVNILPALTQDMSIPLNITSIEGGEMTMIIETIDGMPESSCLFLEDVDSGEFTQVMQGDEVIFQTTENYTGTRFILHMTGPIQMQTNQITCAQANDASITAIGPGEGPFNYTWYDENDNMIAEFAEVYGPSTIEELSFGNYTVWVESSNAMCNTISETVYISNVQEESITLYSEPDACDQLHPGIIVITPENITEFTYTVTDEDNNIVLSGSSSEAVVEELIGGVYEVIVNTSCNEFNMTADVSDPNQVEINLDEEIHMDMIEGGVLVEFDAEIENADDVIWSINGEEVSNLFDFEYLFTEEGLYAVQVVAHGEFCSKSAIQNVFIGSSTGVESIETESTVEMFQTQDQLMFSFDSSYSRASIDVINVVGQSVISHSIIAQEGGVYTQDLNRLSQGTYIVRILADGKMIYTKKFVK